MAHNTHKIGVRGEEIASRYLRSKGYSILERNYRAGRNEIDIIARWKDTIVFCEVKTARTPRFGPSVTWVTPQKIRHIALVAREFIRTIEEENLTFRFDVIGLDEVDGTIAINHIENAFTVPEDM